VNLDSENFGLSIEERKARLKPGERAYGLLPNGIKSEIVGEVPYDGSTRQQRRAMARDAAPAPHENPAGE
jgi:hypothetical protein